LDDAGERHTVSSTEVNDYLREITGEDITAKDFRTWAGTNLAALALREFERVDNDAMRKRAVVRAVERVAKHLGNTPAICRRCYIHPAIFDGFLDGTLLATLAERTGVYLAQEIEGMSAEEAAVVAFLRLRLGEMAEEATAAPGFAHPALAGHASADGHKDRIELRPQPGRSGKKPFHPGAA
jgi:DNA topoisomerase-1